MFAMMLAKDVAATTENVRNPVTENELVGGDESQSGFGVTTEICSIIDDLYNYNHNQNLKFI